MCTFDSRFTCRIATYKYTLLAIQAVDVKHTSHASLKRTRWPNTHRLSALPCSTQSVYDRIHILCMIVSDIYALRIYICEY
jgi:hypothetical protein